MIRVSGLVNGLCRLNSRMMERSLDEAEAWMSWNESMMGSEVDRERQRRVHGLYRFCSSFKA